MNPENKFLSELRSALDKMDKLIHGEGSPKVEDIRKVQNEIEQIRAKYDAEQELVEIRGRLASVPAPPPVEGSGWAGVRQQLLAAVEARGGRIDISGIERRAITSNGSGINTAPGIIRALTDGGKLRPKVSVFLGKNAETVVPVFAPSVAVPEGTVPGATGTASDSTAVLKGHKLTLKPWYSTLQISKGALASSDIEAELPAIFSDAFGAAIDKGIIVGAGSGSDMLGVFIASADGVATAQDLTATGTAAAPAWADYISMSLELLALGGDLADLAIVVAPGVFKTALASTDAGMEPLKNEFLLKGTILGIQVILSSYALSTLTTGSYVAVGGYFKHYALAVAMEIAIDKIATVGSDNYTFQAWMYMQGKPLISTSFRRLKTGA